MGASDELIAALTAPETKTDEVFKVWKENWASFEVFRAMGTQWRVGMNGCTGLDYAVLPGFWSLFKIKRRHRRGVFEDLRIMENEALKIIHKRSGNDR